MLADERAEDKSRNKASHGLFLVPVLVLYAGFYLEICLLHFIDLTLSAYSFISLSLL